MDRRMELHNNTDAPLYLREHQYAAVHGHYSHVTMVDRDGVVDNFPATLYQNRNRDSLRPSEIVLFVGESEVQRSLTPETFVRFVRLEFELDKHDHDNLLVYGIPSRFTDFGCFLGFRFRGRGDYSRRTRILILRSPIIQVD